MKKKFLKTKNWFTFVELITTITIIAILSTIWFVTYYKNIENSRDSQRKTELSWLASWLKQYKTKRWEYPQINSWFNILNNWNTVAKQWLFDKDIVISTVEEIPKDPYINQYYIYSTTSNSQEFELWGTLENNWINKAFLIWDYKSVSKDILPTIILAIKGTTDIEIADWVWEWSINRTKFVFSNWSHNLVYSMINPYLPVSDWTNFTSLIWDSEVEWWQNSDYINCTEIIENSKFIWTWQYQINSWWTLTDVTCP